MKSPPKRSISTSHVISRCLWKLASSTLGHSIWQEIGPGVSLMNNCSIIVYKIFSKLSSSIHVNKVRFIPGIQIGLLPKIKHWQSPTPNIILRRRETVRILVLKWPKLPRCWDLNKVSPQADLREGGLSTPPDPWKHPENLGGERSLASHDLVLPVKCFSLNPWLCAW